MAQGGGAVEIGVNDADYYRWTNEVGLSPPHLPPAFFTLLRVTLDVDVTLSTMWSVGTEMEQCVGIGTKLNTVAHTRTDSQTQGKKKKEVGEGRGGQKER